MQRDSPSPELPYHKFDRLFKLMLLGERGVGKTQFMHRFGDDVFNSTYTPSIGKWCVGVSIPSYDFACDFKRAQVCTCVCVWCVMPVYV